MLTAVATPLTFSVQPRLSRNLVDYSFGAVRPVVAIAGLAFTLMPSGSDRNRFLGSAAYGGQNEGAKHAP
ncbi:MAG: hypothetical protein R2762_04700 [Bryobacteraceae bacterium]